MSESPRVPGSGWCRIRSFWELKMNIGAGDNQRVYRDLTMDRR